MRVCGSGAAPSAGTNQFPEQRLMQCGYRHFRTAGAERCGAVRSGAVLINERLHKGHKRLPLRHQSAAARFINVQYVLTTRFC